jgi:hypothetical protein
MRPSKHAAFFLVVMAVLTFMGAGTGCGPNKEGPSKTQTVTDKPLADEAFNAGISIEEKLPLTLKANSSVTLQIKIKNKGKFVWPSLGQADGTYGINLSYHWADKKGNTTVSNGLRTPLSHDLSPNEEMTVQAIVATPTQRGEYILEFDLVQELVAWFKDKGSQTTALVVRIE